MGNVFFKKEKKNNPIVFISIMCLFVFAIIYCIVSLISSAFHRPDVYYKATVKENLERYDKEYSNNFYILDNQVANFLEALDKEMYSKLYSILDDSYKKIYSRNEVIKMLKDYRENVFKYNDGNTHDYKGHLLNAYVLDGGKYLVQLDFDGNDFYMVLGRGQKNYVYTFVE